MKILDLLQVSVFTLVYIAYDRFLHIAHAMEFRKIGYRSALFLLLVTWLGCSAIAIVPAVVKTYFVDDVRRVGFYGTSSICMPLQLPGQDTIAWEYCLTIFGILNFIGAAYLVIAYIQMFYSSYSSAKDSNNSSRLGAHTTMAKRFAAVVFTDVCCWVPIAMLLFLSLARAINDTGDTLYLWFSICVIPINSAINPILYTLSTPMFWQKVKDVIKKFIFSVSKSKKLFCSNILENSVSKNIYCASMLLKRKLIIDRYAFTFLSHLLGKSWKKPFFPYGNTPFIRATIAHSLL